VCVCVRTYIVFK